MRAPRPDCFIGCRLRPRSPAPPPASASPSIGSHPLDILWILGVIALAAVVALIGKGVEKL
jgi:hypothetical protein